MKRLEVFGIDQDDLKEILSGIVQAEIEKLKAVIAPSSQEVLLTRKEVASMLHINISTVADYQRTGKLKFYGLGGRIYFKRSEIEASLQPLEPQQ